MMKRLGAPLIAGGAIVWTLGVAAWVSGVGVSLPPDAVRSLVPSLAAVSGGGLVVAGAFVRRDGQRAAAAALRRKVPVSASPLMEAPYAQAETRAPAARVVHSPRESVRKHE